MHPNGRGHGTFKLPSGSSTRWKDRCVKMRMIGDNVPILVRAACYSSAGWKASLVGYRNILDSQKSRRSHGDPRC
jgi:hypothetical protein